MDPGEYRLIHHLSHPGGSSINDVIDHNLATVSYATFNDAVQTFLLLGRGTLLSKTDVDSAFRIIPIHTEDHDLLGIKFNDRFYYDTCLPMGCSSAPAIVDRFSSALEHNAIQHLGIANIIHILDDFLILGPPDSPTCQQNLNRFISFCAFVGVPIKSEKTENANNVMTFMGLELDSVQVEAHLPFDKLEKLCVKLKDVKRTITLKELQSL